jgi:hypothetical protein
MNEGGMQALEILDFKPLEKASWIDFWKGKDHEANVQRSDEAKGTEEG